MIRVGNKYYVYDDKGMILIITRSKRIAENVYNTRVAR